MGDTTGALGASALQARASLARVGQHIQAGSFEPTPAQYVELWELVAALSVAAQVGEPAELMDVLARVDEFLRRVCPQARGEGN